MKRLALLFIIAVFGVALMSACKTSNCPAYSQVDTEEVEQTA